MSETDILTTNHARGCAGAEYLCTCGYDDAKDTELRRWRAHRPLALAKAPPLGREQLGRTVREAWVRWAMTQAQPKPAWLVAYDLLSEADKEADRQIGEAVARRIYAVIKPVRRWRHDVTGDVRDEVGRADLVTADLGGRCTDGTQLVLYRARDGLLLARQVDDFEAGRTEDTF